jgi:hypothetical protein
MKAAQREPDAVRQSIADFFTARRTGGWPVSVSEGVASVRRWHPNTRLSDQELCSMVADYAVGRGLNVYFDGRRRPTAAG